MPTAPTEVLEVLFSKRTLAMLEKQKCPRTSLRGASRSKPSQLSISGKSYREVDLRIFTCWFGGGFGGFGWRVCWQSFLWAADFAIDSFCRVVQWVSRPKFVKRWGLKDVFNSRMFWWDVIVVMSSLSPLSSAVIIVVSRWPWAVALSADVSLSDARPWATMWQMYHCLTWSINIIDHKYCVKSGFAKHDQKCYMKNRFDKFTQKYYIKNGDIKFKQEYCNKSGHNIVKPSTTTKSRWTSRASSTMPSGSTMMPIHRFDVHQYANVNVQLDVFPNLAMHSPDEVDVWEPNVEECHRWSEPIHEICVARWWLSMKYGKCNWYWGITIGCSNLSSL